MNKCYYIVITLIILLPFVAGQELLTYEQGASIDIKESCHNNGSLCSGSAICNITVINPQGTNLVDNLAMSQDTSLAFFNYTLASSQTNTVGFYRYDIVCTDSGNTDFGSFNFQVTAGGIDPSLAQVMTNALLLLILGGMFLLNLWGFLHLSWKNKLNDFTQEVIGVDYMKHIKTILLFTLYLQSLFITWVGWKMSQTLIFLDFVSPLMAALFWALLAICLPLFIGLMLFTIIFWVNDKKIHKALIRGIPTR